MDDSRVRNLQAKPTMFKGIEFRSKSEAIFAVALDNIDNAVWQYEPQLPGFCFDVDFIVVCSNGSQLFTFVCEYKPRQPSDHFIDTCMDCYEAFLASDSWFAQRCVGFWIMYGSPFEKERILDCIKIHELCGKSPNPTDMIAVMQKRFINASHHRFDLL